MTMDPSKYTDTAAHMACGVQSNLRDGMSLSPSMIIFPTAQSLLKVLLQHWQQLQHGVPFALLI